VIERLLRDGAVYALAAMVSRGVSFLLVPIYTRVLAPAQYGALELILTAGLLVTLVVALEVGQGMAREWAEQTDAAQRRALASTALTFTLLAHAAFLALALAASAPLTQALLGSPAFTAEVRAGLVFIAINAVFLQLQNQFRWDLRVRSYAAVSVLYGVLTLALGAALGHAYGLQGVLWGQALAAALSCAGGLVLLRGQVGLRLDARHLRRMLRFSLPLVPSGVAIFASFYVNRLILSAFASLPEVGVLGVGQRVAGVGTLLIVGLQGALTPLVYRHHHEPGVPAQLARIFEGFVAAALLTCMVLSVFARELIGWLAAPGFGGAASLLPWLAPAALLSQMYIFAPGIAIARKTSWQLMLTSLSAVLAVGLSLLLIPSWGASGAAVASFAAAALFLACWVAASQRVYPLPLQWSKLGLTVAAYIGLVCAALAIDQLGWPFEAALAMRSLLVGALLAMLVATGLLRRERPGAPGVAGHDAGSAL
jgi:O-antigen/teichoic acid export membrane protein